MSIFQWLESSSDITNLQALASHTLYEVWLEGMSHGYSNDWVKHAPETHIKHAILHLLPFLGPRVSAVGRFFFGRGIKSKFSGESLNDHLSHALTRILLALCLRLMLEHRIRRV